VIVRLAPHDRSGGSNTIAGVDAGDEVDGGAGRYGRASIATAAMSAVVSALRDESQERGSETPDPGNGTKTLERSEAHEGRRSSRVAIRTARRRCRRTLGGRRRRPKARQLGNERSKTRRSGRVTDKDERGAEWPNIPLEQQRR